MTPPSDRAADSAKALRSRLIEALVALAAVCLLAFMVVANRPTGIERAQVVSGQDCHLVVHVPPGSSSTTAVTGHRRKNDNCVSHGRWAAGTTIWVQRGHQVDSPGQDRTWFAIMLVALVGALVALVLTSRRLAGALRDRPVPAG